MNRYYKNGELLDRKIVAALQRAAKDYENGEIIEVRSVLWEILSAIDEWTENYC